MDTSETKPTVTLRAEGRTAVSYWLEVHDDGEPRLFPLPVAPVLVGTSPRAELRLDDDTVSSLHCRLEAGTHGVRVVDLASRNGIYVSGARVEAAECGPGAVVGVGRSMLVLHEVLGDVDAHALASVPPLTGVAGTSLAMRHLAREVRRLSEQSEPVLIMGETGTGKELVARAVHEEGRRASRPFVAVNVAALPRELVESELFGHERGAFTGAVARRAGAFAEAEGGTLFLDEIGERPLEAQPKLLRALDGYEVRAVGGSGSGRRIPTRVVAATHQSLRERVDRGLFRRDLFHRLEVFVIELPPLRARRGDIPLICHKLLALEECVPRRMTPGAAARLTAHDWPGNVRELRNVLVRAAHFAGDAPIATQHVEMAFRMNPSGRLALSPGVALALLREHQGNLSAAARAAHVPRTTFRRLIR